MLRAIDSGRVGADIIAAMKRFLPLLLLGSVLPLGVPPALAQSEPFRVANGATVPAVALHAVRTGRPDWGSNLLNRGPLAPGGEFSLRPAEGAGCRFDIRLVLQDGQEIVRRNADICAQRTIAMAAPPATPAPRQGPPTAMAALPGAKPPPLAPAAPGAVPAPATPPSARPNPQARSSSGTGFVVGADLVMTNQHVIEGCSRIFVRTADNRTLPVTQAPVADARRDLALLRVPGNPGPTLAFRANPCAAAKGS